MKAPSHWAAITYLVHAAPRTVFEIADLLECGVDGVRLTLSRLREEGLVDRKYPATPRATTREGRERSKGKRSPGKPSAVWYWNKEPS